MISAGAVAKDGIASEDRGQEQGREQEKNTGCQGSQTGTAADSDTPEALSTKVVTVEVPKYCSGRCSDRICHQRTF